MTASTAKVTQDGVPRYWPFAAGGLVGPVAAAALARWISLHFAVGLTMSVAFAAAHWLFQRSVVRPNQRSLQTSILAGVAGGLVAGLLAFLFPWR